MEEVHVEYDAFGPKEHSVSFLPEDKRSVKTLPRYADVQEQFALHWPAPDPIYDVRIGLRQYRSIIRRAFRAGFRRFSLNCGDGYPAIYFAGISMFWIARMHGLRRQSRANSIVVPFCGFRIAHGYTDTLSVTFDFRPDWQAFESARAEHGDKIRDEVLRILGCVINVGPASIIAKYSRGWSQPQLPAEVTSTESYLAPEPRESITTTRFIRIFTTQLFQFPLSAACTEFSLAFSGNPNLLQLLYWVQDAHGNRVDNRIITETRISVPRSGIQSYPSDFTLSGDKRAHGLALVPCHTITYNTPDQFVRSVPPSDSCCIDKAGITFGVQIHKPEPGHVLHVCAFISRRFNSSLYGLTRINWWPFPTYGPGPEHERQQVPGFFAE